MLSRFSALSRCFAVLALCSSSAVQALEFPLPSAGNDLVGQIQVIKAKYEDTFADLGTANNLGYLEMIAANPGVDAWLPGEGTEVVLPTRFILPPGPREGIVINLPEYRLYYYPKGRNVVYTYPLGIGREGWESPLGVGRVTVKTPNPAWYPPKSIREEHAAEGDILPTVVPPGPNNPLGPYKMTLSFPGYLIHGSNKKFGIGMRVSHGCFRMLNHNVLELAAMVPVGTKVTIINEPFKFGFNDGKVYLEAHDLLAEDEQAQASVADKHTAVINALLKNDQFANLQLDWDMVREVVQAADGIPVAIDQGQVSARAPTAPADANLF